LEFNKLLREIPEEVPQEKPNWDYRLVMDRDGFLSLLQDLRESKCFAIDVETTSPYPVWADLVGMSLSHTPHQAFYIPVGHQPREGVQQLPLSWVWSE
jgi:DNA polymerase-1